MTSLRAFKFSENIRKNLSIVIRKEIKPEYLVSIQSVEVSPDFRSAKVYVVPMNASVKLYDNNYLKELKNYLTSIQGEFSFKLAKLLVSKFSPKLFFIIDNSLSKVDEIEKLISKK